METLKELLQSVIDSYKDRIKSPLIGSFVLSYFVCNWRAVAILFFLDWPINCRIDYIDARYMDDKSFYLPFGIALFYVMILPYVNLFFEKFLSIYFKYTTNKVKNKRKDSLLLQKDEAKLIKEISDARAGTSTIDNLNERNKALTDQIEILNNQINDHINQYNVVVEQLQIEKETKTSEITRLKNQYQAAVNLQNFELKKIKYMQLTGASRPVTDQVFELENELNAKENDDFLKLAASEIFSISNLPTPFAEKILLLKLIERENRNTGKLNHYQLTELGNNYFSYLKNGFDI